MVALQVQQLLLQMLYNTIRTIHNDQTLPAIHFLKINKEWTAAWTRLK